MKAVLLCRVSSKEQEETGYSLPAQEKLLKEYATRQNYDAAKVFSISESASGRKQREIFNGMMDYINREGVKIVIIEKVDRLTRNFKDAVMVDEWLDKDEERQVHFVKDSLVLHKNSRSQEKLNWAIRIVFAKNYIDNLSEEVKKGQKEKIAQGWLPTRPPYGYKTIGEKGHKTHIPDADKIPFAKKMFDLYVTGNYSLRRLTQMLYDSGMRSSGGAKVPKSRIAKYLSDPFYIGQIRWNDELYPGNQETFIDPEIFAKVQVVLKGKNTPKYRKHAYLFQSLIHCQECGGLITWETQKSNVYGHCNHYRGCTQKVWFKEPEIENQILTIFDKLRVQNARIVEWIRKAIKDSHKDEIEYYSASVTELNRRLETAEKRFGKMYDDKIDGQITEEFYQKKLKQYTQEKETIQQSLKKHSNANAKYYELATNIYDLSQRAKEIWLKTQVKEYKRQLIKLIFASLTINAGVLSYTYTKAFQILSAAVDATNSSKMDKVAIPTARIFEPTKKADVLGQSADFGPQWTALLPKPPFNINESIERLIKIIQELASFGSLPPLKWDYETA